MKSSVSVYACSFAFASRTKSSFEGIYCGCENEGVEERSSNATVQICDLMMRIVFFICGGLIEGGFGCVISIVW